MRIAILQPGYLPWLGYFDQLARVDVFVHYDDVQYTRADWRNRNRIKSPTGPAWLSIPVLTKNHRTLRICDIVIAADTWRATHRKSIEHAYRRAPFFDLVFPWLDEFYSQPVERLADACIASAELLARLIGIETRTVRGSALSGFEDLRKTDRLIAICRHFGATDYLSGAAARGYLDVAAFTAAGIRVEFQEYRHPLYPQLWGDFASHLSVVDLLMNAGPASRKILTGSRLGSCISA